MDYERALGRVNEYAGWCERSIWIQQNEGSGVVDENTGPTADAVPAVRALAVAKVTVASPPNSNVPARVVRRPRRMPVRIRLLPSRVRWPHR